MDNIFFGFGGKILKMYSNLKLYFTQPYFIVIPKLSKQISLQSPKNTVWDEIIFFLGSEIRKWVGGGIQLERSVHFVLSTRYTYRTGRL